MVGGVSSYGYPHHPITWNPHQANIEDEVSLLDPSKIEKPKLPPPFMHDKFISETKQELNPVAKSLNPVLKKPEELDIEEIKAFMHKVDAIGAKFEVLALEAQRIQRELSNEYTQTLGEELQSLQARQRALVEEYNDAWKTLTDRTKTSKIMGWVDNMFSFGFLAATVVGVGLAVCTAGVSLAFTAAAVGLLGIAKAATAVGNGVVKYELGKDQALVDTVKYGRELTKRQTSDTLQTCKEVYSSIASTCKQTREYLENYQAALAANISR